MKRVWGHVLSGLTLVGAIGAAGGVVAACVHDNSTIFVHDVLAPSFVTSGMACVFTADPTQPVLGEGTLDVGLRSEYTAVVLVGNQIVPRGDPNQPHTETSFVTLEGAVVRVVDSGGNQLNTYTQPAAVTIPPSSGTTPGYASLGVTIVDSGTAKALKPQVSGVMNSGKTVPIVSYVRFFGHTLGGESVESDEFGFPVNVCAGCLVSFPVAEDDPNLSVQPNCALAAAASSSSSSASSSVPCFVGQDLPVDCSACAKLNPYCQTFGGQGATVLDAGGGGG
jgi:hypothetical protein